MKETVVKTTTTQEIRTHADGFIYKVCTVSDSTGFNDCYAVIDSIVGVIRSSDPPSYRINGKHYRFNGEELVCVGTDPQIGEMRERIRLLIENLMAKRTHVFYITCACGECDARTILFCEKHGSVDIGCGEAYSIIGEFATINNTGRIIGACDASDDRTVQRIINEYQDTFCEIEEWINASVPQQV